MTRFGDRSREPSEDRPRDARASVTPHRQSCVPAVRGGCCSYTKRPPGWVPCVEEQRTPATTDADQQGSSCGHFVGDSTDPARRRKRVSLAIAFANCDCRTGRVQRRHFSGQLVAWGKATVGPAASPGCPIGISLPDARVALWWRPVTRQVTVVHAENSEVELELRGNFGSPGEGVLGRSCTVAVAVMSWPDAGAVTVVVSAA